jgi:hypothetical protein
MHSKLHTFQLKYGSGVCSACGRDEYHKISEVVESSRRVELAIWPPSVNRLSRQCGILDILQPCRPPRPITGIALLFCVAFIVCNVYFIICVALFAVLFERGLLFCVVCVFFVSCLIAVPLPRVKPHLQFN